LDVNSQMKHNQNLLENSKELCNVAGEILAETKALDMFSVLGRIEVIGSLRLELMFRNDIDLLVISEVIEKQKAEDVTKKFSDMGIFSSIILKDYQSNPEYDMPLGFYWELGMLKNGKEWKFDVWYLKPDERYTDLVMSAIERFELALKQNPEKGELILKLKQNYFDGVKYKNNIKSIDIYTAVLEKGIDSVEEFEVNKESLVGIY